MFFSLNTTTVFNIPNDRTRNNLKNRKTLKCYSSDEPARGFTAMNAKVTVLPKRDLNHIYTEASINRRLVKKGWNFSGP